MTCRPCCGTGGSGFFVGGIMWDGTGSRVIFRYFFSLDFSLSRSFKIGWYFSNEAIWTAFADGSWCRHIKPDNWCSLDLLSSLFSSRPDSLDCLAVRSKFKYSLILALFSSPLCIRLACYLRVIYSPLLISPSNWVLLILASLYIVKLCFFFFNSLALL